MDPTDTIAANKSIYMAPSPIPPSPAPSSSSDDKKALDYDFDPVIPEEEREFYRKAYPTIEVVRDRKVHCTVCKTHIGTAPVQEENIKMHPILRVTHCIKCHDFYNSGEFSKGEDGSELYCRWCGQGGEVYCCSSCPYVFCKACIMKNLSRGVVADIEQNENWSCFSCAPKILWPLRGQHWALKKYIDKQKRAIESMGVPEDEKIQLMSKDRSTCCRIAKSKAGNMSDSMESIDSITSRRSHGSSSSAKKKVPTYARATPSPLPPAPKKQKTNDEVVCTPDLMSMLEPDCQITVSKPRPTPPPITSVPKIMSIQPGYNRPPPAPVPQRTNVAPPPLVFRNGVQPRNIAPSPNVVRRTYVSPRPSTPGNTTPVYHTINGYCIDLNTAAQQETFRLPNGKLIQVKRQGTQIQSPIPNNNPWQYPRPQHNPPVTIRNTPIALPPQHQMQNYPIQQQNINNPVPPLAVQSPRYRNPTMVGNTTVTPIGVQQLQLINGNLQVAPQNAPPVPKTVLVRQVFSDTPIGQVRSQLQDKIFNAMEICQHLSTKVQTLTNSNAYKQARSYMEIKELYIHLSYLITYGIGRFKGLQDKCLNDMREMGFSNDADSLESGQLPADKQASDDEDNEIEIVEPKTDTINLDSDLEDDEPPKKSPEKKTKTPEKTATDLPTTIFELDPAQFLRSILSTNEDDFPATFDESKVKKQPRKKTTVKPNPTLIKQKQMLERERMEDMQRNAFKHIKKCTVTLKKAEDDFAFVGDLLKEINQEKIQEIKNNESFTAEKELNSKTTTDNVNIIQEPTNTVKTTSVQTFNVQLLKDTSTISQCQTDPVKDTLANSDNSSLNEGAQKMEIRIESITDDAGKKGQVEYIIAGNELEEETEKRHEVKITIEENAQNNQEDVPNNNEVEILIERQEEMEIVPPECVEVDKVSSTNESSSSAEKMVIDDEEESLLIPLSEAQQEDVRNDNCIILDDGEEMVGVPLRQQNKSEVILNNLKGVDPKILVIPESFKKDEKSLEQELPQNIKEKVEVITPELTNHTVIKSKKVVLELTDIQEIIKDKKNKSEELPTEHTFKINNEKLTYVNDLADKQETVSDKDNNSEEPAVETVDCIHLSESIDKLKVLHDQESNSEQPAIKPTDTTDSNVDKPIQSKENLTENLGEQCVAKQPQSSDIIESTDKTLQKNDAFTMNESISAETTNTVCEDPEHEKLITGEEDVNLVREIAEILQK